jgi:predicted nucleic acid-binding protein
VTLYAESSAVLAWLLGETAGGDIRRRLGAADAVVTSDLTLVECDRVLIRATRLGELSESAADRRRADLAAAAAHWTLLRIGSDVIDRARRRFPQEPVRALDALHLASALVVKTAVSDFAVLSLDGTIRANARALGCHVDPPDGRA